MGGDRLSVSVLPANRVDTGEREGGKCSSSVLLPRYNGTEKVKLLPIAGGKEKGKHTCEK